MKIRTRSRDLLTPVPIIAHDLFAEWLLNPGGDLARQLSEHQLHELAAFLQFYVNFLLDFIGMVGKFSRSSSAPSTTVAPTLF
jgi:hypothetical protein